MLMDHGDKFVLISSFFLFIFFDKLSNKFEVGKTKFLLNHQQSQGPLMMLVVIFFEIKTVKKLVFGVYRKKNCKLDDIFQLKKSNVYV